MHAHVGDRLVIEGGKVDAPRRIGEVVEVRGPDGGPPYVVKWDDGHEGLRAGYPVEGKARQRRYDEQQHPDPKAQGHPGPHARQRWRQQRPDAGGQRRREQAEPQEPGVREAEGVRDARGHGGTPPSRR